MTDHDDLNRRLAALIDDGLTVQHCLDALSRRLGPKQRRLIRNATFSPLLEDGVLEVDIDAVVSSDEEDIEESEGGYVLAWLWVDDDRSLSDD